MKLIIYSLFFSIAMVSTAMATPPYVYQANTQVQQVIVPQRTVEFDQQYYQGINSYFSVGDKIRAEKASETDAQIEFYKGQVDMLLKILAQKTGTPIAPAPTTPPAEQPPAEQPPILPQPPDNGEYKVTEVDKKVYNIVKTKCARCHGDTKQDGGLALIKDGSLQLVDINDRVEIHDRTLGINLEARGKTRMPKGGVPLTDDEVETFRLWAVQESDMNRNK